MSWAVGDDRYHGRFRGYGVPAYCDAKGCRAKIDRGFGYVCEGTDCARPGEDGEDGVDCFDLDPLEKSLFVCGQHTCRDVDESDLPPEHPEWVEHLLTDESWERWRLENPDRAKAMEAAR